MPSQVAQGYVHPIVKSGFKVRSIANPSGATVVMKNSLLMIAWVTDLRGLWTPTNLKLSWVPVGLSASNAFSMISTFYFMEESVHVI
jgi:hypothetical protein